MGSCPSGGCVVSQSPGMDYINPVSVGYIYLTVFNDLSMYDPEITLDLNDLVLFNFGTTGNENEHDVLLFNFHTKNIHSPVEKNSMEYVVCSITKKEVRFSWLNGKERSGYVNDPWLSPYEMEQHLAER